MTKDHLITQAVESFKEKFKFTLFDGDAEKYNPPMFAVISFLTSKLAEAYEAGQKEADWHGERLIDAVESGKKQGQTSLRESLREAVEKLIADTDLTEPNNITRSFYAMKIEAWREVLSLSLLESKPKEHGSEN